MAEATNLLQKAATSPFGGNLRRPLVSERMAESGETLIPPQMQTAEQIAEMDRQTIKSFRGLRWWFLLLLGGVALIVAAIALDKIRGAPDAVASYVSDAQTQVMDTVAEELNPIFLNLTVRIITLEATVEYLAGLVTDLTTNCVCVAPTTAPPPTTAAPPSGPSGPTSKKREAVQQQLESLRRSRARVSNP